MPALRTSVKLALLGQTIGTIDHAVRVVPDDRPADRDAQGRPKTASLTQCLPS